jgi:hypothetical protein
MTIAAGILCSDGLIIAADGEVTQNYMKSQRVKLFQCQNLLEGLTIIGAGSGDEFFVDTVVQKFNEQFDVETPDLVSIKNEIERIVREACQAAWPLFESKDKPGLQLLLGLKAIDGFGLVEVNGPLVRSVNDYGYIGYGTELATYKSKFILSKIYPCEALLPIVINILKVVKDNAMYCGGDTSIWVLDSNGAVEVKPHSYITKFETVHIVLEKLWQVLPLVLPYIPPHQQGKTMLDLLMEHADKFSPTDDLHAQILKFVTSMRAKQLNEQNPTDTTGLDSEKKT